MCANKIRNARRELLNLETWENLRDSLHAEGFSFGKTYLLVSVNEAGMNESQFFCMMIYALSFSPNQSTEISEGRIDVVKKKEKTVICLQIFVAEL